MGFFSQDCEGCGHPALSEQATETINAWMNDVVVITAHGSVIRGSYDGYGTVREPGSAVEHEYAIGDGNTVWHTACWEKAGKPTDFRGESRRSEDQGWFFGDGEHSIPDPRLGQETPLGPPVPAPWKSPAMIELFHGDLPAAPAPAAQEPRHAVEVEPQPLVEGGPVVTTLIAPVHPEADGDLWWGWQLVIDVEGHVHRDEAQVLLEHIHASATACTGGPGSDAGRVLMDDVRAAIKAGGLKVRSVRAAKALQLS